MSDNTIKWIHKEVTKGSKRTVSVHGVRTSEAKLKLTDSQRQASIDISHAYQDLEKGYGYALLGMKNIDFERVAGGQVDDDMIDRMRTRLGRLHEWQFEVDKRYRHAVEAISIHGKTCRSYSEQIGVSDKTIADWYRKGLDVYCGLFYDYV